MSCLSLAYWENVIIAVIVIIAIVALLRLLVAALGASSGPIWPPTSPFAGPAPSDLLGFIGAAISIIIWAIILIALVLFIFSLISCLLGAVGGFRLFPRTDLAPGAVAAACHLQGLLI